MNRTQITILLLVALGVAIGYAWIATPKQRRVTPGQRSQHQTTLPQKKGSPASFPVVADLDFSSGGDNPYQKPQKNLFAPLYPPPKVVKRPPAPRPVAKVTKPVVRPQQIIPVAIQPQNPKPIQSLNVLGYLDKTGEYTVFLASRQGDIFLVKKGDAFADDLVVRSISPRNITIGRRQTDQQVVLQLGEAKSQRLPKIRFQSGRPEFKPPKAPETRKPETRKPEPKKPEPVKGPDVNNLKFKG